MSRNYYVSEYRQCSYCKKMFTGEYIWTDYVYKIDNKYYCGWECYRKAEHKKRYKNDVIYK